LQPLNPIFSLLIFAIAFLTAHALKYVCNFKSVPGRNDTIDGLRGFLAMSVFICHTAIWYQYLSKGVWQVTPSNLYNQFGQTGVDLFFMITSFLFISKLLNAKTSPFDWHVFFINRVYRIFPMYLASFALIVLIVLFISGWRINVGEPAFIASLADWIFFTIRNAPAINGISFTNNINAGVTWSLRYEWLFYFCLPLLSLLIMKTKPPLVYCLLGLCFLWFFYHTGVVVNYYLYCFLGGAFAAFFIKYVPVAQKPVERYGAAVIILCLFFIGQFWSANSIRCIVLITVVFTLIASGNALFGVLKNPAIKLLGEICYSTYLLHGILLFCLFYGGLGIEASKKLSSLHYCLLIFALTPLLVILSYWAYHFIEKPFINSGKRVANKIKLRNGQQDSLK